MMSPPEIEQKVKQILSRKLKVEEGKIGPETRLAEDLGVDSFGAIELMFEVEEEFGLKIPDSDIDHVRRVKDIVAYVADWQAKQAKG